MKSGETLNVDGVSVTLCQDDIPDEVLNKLLQEKTFACDLEYKTLELNNFYIPKIKLALIQIYSPNTGVSVVRVQNGVFPENIVKLMSEESIEKVFHHAFMDCSLIYYNWKVLPKNLVCTKEAAKLFNMDKEKSSSLLELLKGLLNVEISKTERTSDWLAESLTREQVSYAARDTIYLFKLHKKLNELLVQKGDGWMEAAKLNWEALPAQIFNNIKGVHGLYGELYNY